MTSRVRNASIQRRLTLTVLATSGFSLFLVCVAFLSYDITSIRDAMVRDTKTLARVVGTHVAMPIQFLDEAAVAESLAALAGADDVELAAVYDAEGRLFASYTSMRAVGESRLAPALGEPGHTFASDRMELFEKIELEDDLVGTIFLRIDTKPLVSRVWHYAGLTGVLLLVVGFVSVAASARLRRSISWPLEELARGSEAIADGDLSVNVRKSADDEIGSLANTFNAMTRRLRELVTQIHRSTSEVVAVSSDLQGRSHSLTYAAERQKSAILETEESSRQVHESIHELNDNAEQLAETARDTSDSMAAMDASIGEVATHMEALAEAIELSTAATDRVTANLDQVGTNVETLRDATAEAIACLAGLSASVSQVEANAVESQQLSNDSSSEAAVGRRAVSDTVSAMAEISTSFGQLERNVSELAERSQAIDEIVKVIDAVSGETNLLALNASIIASQAGEHGRAFAVVASEIRGLADRTGNSTREIVESIQAVQEETAKAVAAVADGSQKVESGVRLSHQAGAVLERIIEKSQRSTERVEEIVAATGRQNLDLRRVDAAMREVDRIVDDIHGSTSVQHVATAEISSVVENLRTLGQSVSSSTTVQKGESRRITLAVERVTRMIEHIVAATQAQAESHDKIRQALVVFGEVTNETILHAAAVSEMVGTLSQRSQLVESEIRRFRT